MNVLVVIFGGLDHEFLSRWDCKNLKQAQWGRVTVDQLWDKRDVATQITAQLITGKTWRENGVNERKKVDYIYKGSFAKFCEERVFKGAKRARGRRHGLYQMLGSNVIALSREFLREDLHCPTLFEVIDNSKAVYVPAYNPEPTWAVDRNILDPRKYPELGVEAALDLREKHFFWRKKRFLEELGREEPYNLLMAQFQYIDSSQHLYISYHEDDQMDEVEAAYWRMDDFAEEILSEARGKYQKILFISDNGAARKVDYKPTHHNRPYYSLNEQEDLDGVNLRDFFGHIQRWSSTPSKASTDL